MTKTLGLLALVAAATQLAACGSVNSALADRHETVEMYHIWDVKTSAQPDVLIRAAADGVASNTNSVTQNRPLIMGGLVPATPGRFQIVDMQDAFKGTGMGAMLAMANGGAGNATMRSAKCDGAVWTSKAVRTVTGSDNLNLYTCLYRYTSGYQIDMYAVFTKESGGLTQLARSAAQAMVGTPEEWTNKTIMDTVRAVQLAAGQQVTHVEGQPDIDKLPKLDQVTRR